jgi:peptide/nickel transport system permease protein
MTSIPNNSAHGPWAPAPATADLPAGVRERLEQLEHEDVSGRAVATASQSKLMWWRFRRHTLAVVSVVVLGLLYLIALFADVIAPYDPVTVNASRTYAPPQSFQFMHAGQLSWPYIYGIKSTVDQETLRRTFVPDTSKRLELDFFVVGEPYRLFGFIPGNVRLFGLAGSNEPVNIFGTDRLGRDLFSRMVHATRISLSIGLVAVTISLLLGVTLGGISGYFGGRIDMIIQRVIEFIDAIPSLPLWMGLSAAIPLTWPPLWVYFAITVVLSLLGWTGMARVVRGRFLAMREEDFVMAARVGGSGQRRIIFRHMLPLLVSHIIASLTLTIPGRILGETSLSFLGLGLREPIISYGVLLQDAQNVNTIATAPWLIVPAAVVMIIVIAYNFMGDGLRDAADPYA